jgi:hypothetical protein
MTNSDQWEGIVYDFKFSLTILRNYNDELPMSREKRQQKKKNREEEMRRVTFAGEEYQKIQKSNHVFRPLIPFFKSMVQRQGPTNIDEPNMVTKYVI